MHLNQTFPHFLQIYKCYIHLVTWETKTIVNIYTFNVFETSTLCKDEMLEKEESNVCFCGDKCTVKCLIFGCRFLHWHPNKPGFLSFLFYFNTSRAFCCSYIYIPLTSYLNIIFTNFLYSLLMVFFFIIYLCLW